MGYAVMGSRRAHQARLLWEQSYDLLPVKENGHLLASSGGVWLVGDLSADEPLVSPTGISCLHYRVQAWCIS